MASKLDTLITALYVQIDDLFIELGVRQGLADHLAGSRWTVRPSGAAGRRPRLRGWSRPLDRTRTQCEPSSPAAMTKDLHTFLIDPHGEPRVQGTYVRLRDEILSGSMVPGQVLNQVHLARRLGVSRTPLREALRMLQAEGLVRSEHQRRMRVTAVEPGEIDALYAERVLLESLGIALTVPWLATAELAQIRASLDLMHAGEATGDPSVWELPHRTFHALLVKHAGAALESAIVGLGSRAELYRRLFVRSDPITWATTRDEHDDVLDACMRRDVDDAVRRNGRHLARTALVLCSRLDPEFDPRAVRHALQLVASERRGAAAPA